MKRYLILLIENQKKQWNLSFFEQEKHFISIKPLSFEEFWMLGLESLEVYNCCFNITEENNKFDPYTETFGEFSTTEAKDELEEILDISIFTSEHLKDEIIGPPIISEY